MPNLVQTPDDMTRCINALHTVRKLVYDVETSGLNPRQNHAVGYVLTLGPAPDDTFYVPVRHGGGGNCLDWRGLETTDDPIDVAHPFEIEFAKIAAKPELVVIGHNLGFDLLFSARKGIVFQGRTECTQTAMALIDENLPSFSLDSCARHMRVTEKLGQALYQHIYDNFRTEFKDDVFADKKMMAHYWRLAGNDEVAVDYACGDGVSTWELRVAQEAELDRQELGTVWGVECRVTKTLSRMQHAGIPVSDVNFEQSMTKMVSLIEEAKAVLPGGLNVMSGPQMKALFDAAGITHYPITAKGNPSFPEDWLETTDLGQQVIALRKVRNLVDKFMNPLIEQHVYKGRVFPNYAQLGADEFGTVTGRLSSYGPNIQQVPKRNKKLGRIFRHVFVPDEGFTWASKDYSQCEPRLYAEYSLAQSMIAGYKADPPVDFYQLLANITGKPRSPTPGIGGNCKTLALAIFYGAGNDKTAEMLGIPVNEATQLRNQVKQMVPEIGRFADSAKRAAQSRGWVKTALGRRARFPGGQFTYKAGGRIIQGTNADLIKLAMVEVDDYLISESCPTLFASVHDALEIQYPTGRPEISDEVTRIMEHVAKVEPLSLTEVDQIVDGGQGPTWGIATYGEEK